MTAARIRFKLDLHEDVAKIDIPELIQQFPSSVEFFTEALSGIRARRDDAEAKRGRLLGAFSSSFIVGPGYERAEGRIVYTISAPHIRIYAAHCDHDEAYRRARKRYRAPGRTR